MWELELEVVGVRGGVGVGGGGLRTHLSEGHTQRINGMISSLIRIVARDAHIHNLEVLVDGVPANGTRAMQ